MSDIEEEVRLVSAVLRLRPGFDVSLMAVLSIRTTEQATVEVEWTSEGKDFTRSFPASSLDEAARCFATIRRELRLGLDFEVG